MNIVIVLHALVCCDWPVQKAEEGSVSVTPWRPAPKTSSRFPRGPCSGTRPPLRRPQPLKRVVIAVSGYVQPSLSVERRTTNTLILVHNDLIFVMQGWVKALLYYIVSRCPSAGQKTALGFLRVDSNGSCCSSPTALPYSSSV